MDEHSELPENTMVISLPENLAALRGFLPEIVSVIEDEKGLPYGSVLVAQDGGVGIRALGGEKVSVDPVSPNFGIKITAFNGETFYSRSTTSTDRDSLIAETREFCDGISVVDSGVDIYATEEEAVHHFLGGHTGPAEDSIEKRVEQAKRYSKLMGGVSEKISLPFVYLGEERVSRMFANRKKSLSQVTRFCLAAMAPRAQDDKRQVMNYDGRYGTSTEVFSGHEDFAVTMAAGAIDLLGAGKVAPGEYTTIVDPRMAGVLAHESFGHGYEADWLLGDRSRARRFVGKRVGSELVTIVDQANFQNRHGNIFFDDEGQIASDPTILVDQGILTGQPMTDHWSYLQLVKTNPDLGRTPNGRCENPFHDTYARMTNTFFKANPNGPTVDEMIAATEDGILLEGCLGGMEDPLGWGIQVDSIRGVRIIDGKLTEETYYMPSVTGYVPDFLNSIDMVGSELAGFGGGRCGKGHKEIVPVSSGGPYLRGKLTVG